MLVVSGRAGRRASGRHAMALDGGQLSREHREPALGGRRQLRRRRYHRRQAGDDCRGGLFERADDDLRRRDLPGPGEPVAGGAARLGRTQGVRHEDAMPIITPMRSITPSSRSSTASRHARAGRGHVRERRSASRAPHRGLQEDPLLHAREHRLRQQSTCPDQELHTTAVWWQVDPRALLAAFQDRWQALDGFLGAAYAMHHVAALLTMSERHDLGRAVGDSDSTWSATRGHRTAVAAHAASTAEPVDVERGVGTSSPPCISTTTIQAASACPRRSSICGVRLSSVRVISSPAAIAVTAARRASGRSSRPKRNAAIRRSAQR